jgi:hypothetical protein
VVAWHACIVQQLNHCAFLKAACGWAVDTKVLGGERRMPKERENIAVAVRVNGKKLPKGDKCDLLCDNEFTVAVSSVTLVC